MIQDSYRLGFLSLSIIMIGVAFIKPHSKEYRRIMRTLYRAKAPLRISFGGGGTDLVDYAQRFGGAAINATISMFAHAYIDPTEDGVVVLRSMDRGITTCHNSALQLPDDKEQRLLIGVINRIQRDFVKRPLSFRLTTYVDAPPGSGLGSSSTLVVVIIGAFVEWLKLPLSEYDIANLAYQIEREDLAISGGKQDQFAATFGGFNFMEFNKDGSVLVNPLRIKHAVCAELEQCLLLIHTGENRLSAAIIDSQRRNVQQGKLIYIEALHGVKRAAYTIKKGLLTGDLHSVGSALHEAWESKKGSSDQISNSRIDRLYDKARAAGALGGKISGAGGGGYMMFYCPGDSRYAVMDRFSDEDVIFQPFSFTSHGLTTWRSDYA